MEEKTEEFISYIIPRNVKTRFEFFTGYGWFEIFVLALGFCVGFCFFKIIGAFTKSPARLFLIVICTAASFFLVSPDPKTGSSLLKMYKNFKSYKSKQKRYLYVFGRR
ncbi:MAG: hypothetical protein N2448_06425 [Caloramator sp.]|nr:hypothetical protein [Caloramator sp.]